MTEHDTPIPPFVSAMSLPCVVFGGLLLVYWWTAVPPSAAPEDWRYASFYTSLYKSLLVLGGGLFAVGVLNSLFVGWTYATDVSSLDHRDADCLLFVSLGSLLLCLWKIAPPEIPVPDTGLYEAVSLALFERVLVDVYPIAYEWLPALSAVAVAIGVLPWLYTRWQSDAKRGDDHA